jgi:hypothetical protein
MFSGRAGRIDKGSNGSTLPFAKPRWNARFLRNPALRRNVFG